MVCASVFFFPLWTIFNVFFAQNGRVRGGFTVRGRGRRLVQLLQRRRQLHVRRRVLHHVGGAEEAGR